MGARGRGRSSRSTWREALGGAVWRQIGPAKRAPDCLWLDEFGAVWAGRARISGVRLIFFMPISAASQCEEERKGNQG